MLSGRIRTENPFTEWESVKWSSPYFVEAIKKINRIPSYSGKYGISTFCSHMGITKALKTEQIILGASAGHHHLCNFISSVGGCIIDVSTSPGFNHVLDELHDVMVSHIPNSEWKRVNKRSLSVPNGGQIEYTSSSVDSLRSWTNLYKKLGNSESQLANEMNHLETLITESISHIAFHSREHVVCLQPGALRSPHGTVPQIAHRDFSASMYRDQFPKQLFIGFMPVTSDGCFLQVWNGAGSAKLVYIPYGYFLLLPGDTIHAGWMCTSLHKYNYRLHFYILVSKEINHLSRKESYIFENMNMYIDEESKSKKELSLSYHNALPDFKHYI
jgi:hypothetical protein